MTHTHTHTHTCNLEYWQYQLNQVSDLLKIAITKCELPGETDTLVKVAFDKTVRILCQVGDAINVKTAMENNTKSSKL